MIRKLFGETEEEQLRYLQPRLLGLLVALVSCAIGLVLNIISFEIAGIFYGIANVALVVTLLVFGWAIMRGLFGIASVGILFSNNVVLGVLIFMLYILVGYFGGIVVAAIGLCRFLVLKKKRK